MKPFFTLLKKRVCNPYLCFLIFLTSLFFTSQAQTQSDVFQCATSDVVASSSGPLCAGGTLNLFADDVMGASYLWTGPNGFTSQEQNPSIASVTTAANGTYTVTVTLEGCSNSPTTEVVINALPTVTVNSSTKCASDPAITITATRGSGSVADYNYQWTVPSGTTDPGNVKSFSATAAGQYCVTITNILTGCVSAQGCGTLAVYANPAVTISGVSTTCTSSKTKYSVAGGFNSYAWSITENGTIIGSTTANEVTVQSTGVGSYTLSVIATNSNNCSATASTKAKVTSCGVYTYTQGFYGSTHGQACVPSGVSQTAVQLLTSFLSANNGLTIGNTNSLVFLSGYQLNGKGQLVIGSSSTEAISLNSKMPGRKTPNRINTTSNTSLVYSLATIPLSNGKISNVLLAQTITLALNNGIANNLFNIVIYPDKYLTILKRSGQNCTLPTCENGIAGVIASQKISGLSSAFASWLSNGGNGRTIKDVYDMANDALGGGVLLTGTSYSDINIVVDFINNQFDGGGTFLGNFATQQTTCSLSSGRFANVTVPAREKGLTVSDLTVAAYPNPFTDRLKFTVVSPVSGKATLDVYNVTGQKIRNVYNGYLFANTSQVVDFTVPSSVKGMLIYTLRVGDKVINGKVVQMK